MGKSKPAKLDRHRTVRHALDDDALPQQEDIRQEDAGDDAAHDSGARDAPQADTQPDVLLDVPVLKVEEINLEVEDLNAHVSLQAEVLNLVKLHVGVEASLGHVSLGIKGVDAAAKLRVCLDKVAAIIVRTMTTIDENPQILSALIRGSAEAAGEIGPSAGDGRQQAGGGARSAVASAGDGAKEIAGHLVQSAGLAVEDLVKDADIIVDTIRPGTEAAGSGRKAGQADQRPADQATRRDRPMRPE
jgi:hypothetical protein